MFVNQPDDAQLVALWHDPETCPAIARRLAVIQTYAHDDPRARVCRRGLTPRQTTALLGTQRA